MRIAVVSTVFKKTPPDGYGGIERVVHLQVEQLVREGHEVVLFATPGSYCSGKTVEIAEYDPDKAPSGITSKSDAITEEPLYQAMCSYLEAHPVDIIHDWSFQNLFVMRHPERFPFVISICIPPAPNYQRPNLVACSKAHAGICGPTTRFVRYGLDLENFKFNFEKKKHFIHIAKIARYKGQHITILAARKAGVDLQIAGNIEDKIYYNLIIKPLLYFSPRVSYIGEIMGTNSQLCEAAALVLAPLWFDAFPLVILESFAAGTPVISLDQGGISEQIVSGVNGFLCASKDDLSHAMKSIHEIKPKDCRSYAEEHYSVKRMARDYLKLYESAINGDSW